MLVVRTLSRGRAGLKKKSNTLRVLARISKKTATSQAGDEYKIHPAIGVARLGNSTGDDWIVAPTKIGGLPTEQNGAPVTRFKNGNGEIKRQASKFTVYKNGEPLDMSQVVNIQWKAWIANKKAVWYEFALLAGDNMLPNNSYEYWLDQTSPTGGPVVTIRNDGRIEKQKYIINPGPRAVTTGSPAASFDNDGTYAEQSFPQDALRANGITQFQGQEITSLGDMNMNTSGEASMFLRGGWGKWYGDAAADIESFAGADGLFDDTSDGPVQCILTLDNEEELVLDAYVVCAQPNVAPELDNINTWDDVIFDMAVRYLTFGQERGFVNGSRRFIRGSSGFKPNIEADIAPLFKRMREYMWVSNIAPMTAFATPLFALDDTSEAALEWRRGWLSKLRTAIDYNEPANYEPVSDDPHQWMYVGGDETNEGIGEGYPLMPINAGSGSVNPTSETGPMSKIISMTPTQYYMLDQWAHNFVSATAHDYGFNPLDQASIGNCVGYPSSPGIEVTWSIRNPAIYDANDPYRLKIVGIDALEVNGLAPVANMRDETEEGTCEPGDLSKRMAIPWLADFAYCSSQMINFTDPNVNKYEYSGGVAQPWKLPLYYAYWWPPQSPLHIYVGPRTAAEANHELKNEGSDTPIASSGQNTEYMRGVSQDAMARDVLDMWSYFGFITNTNTDLATRDTFRHFAETERNYEEIEALVNSRAQEETEAASKGMGIKPRIARAAHAHAMSTRAMGRI